MTNTARWLIAILLTILVFAAGCGGGSSNSGDTSQPSMAVEPKPKPANLTRCLTDDGYAVQRESATLVQATPNGHDFVNIREFPSAAEATAYDGGLTVAAHVRVGAKVAYGDSASDVKRVEQCLSAEAP